MHHRAQPPLLARRDQAYLSELPRTPCRNCPKRGASNAPTVDLPVIRRAKWVEKEPSRRSVGLRHRRPPRLFGQFHGEVRRAILPRTVENLRHNPAIEIDVVDPISRKGYRFKGTGTVFSEGALFEEALAFYRRRGVANEIRAVVLVEVGRAMPLTSPAYDLGATEQEVRERHYEALRRGESGAPTGE
jgi:hypothetical protein